MTIPTPPKGMKAPGRKLWRAVLSQYDLEQHEIALLIEACRCIDLCRDLQDILDEHGIVHGVRISPAVVELRQQRLTAAKLLGALRVPLGDEEDASKRGARPQRRNGVRGVYSVAGGAR